MRLDNLHRLRFFVQVAEAASFSQAAKRMFVSQPAVSRQIKELEAAIHVHLVDRMGRRIALTEAGYSLLEHAKRVLQAVEQMEDEMETISGGVGGFLQLGASAVWEYLLPGFMGSFKQRYPQVSLGLTIANTARIADLMLANQLHLGFVGDNPGSRQLEAEPITTDEIVIIAPPNHELAKSKSVSPASLNGMRFIQREADSATAQTSARYLEQLGIKYKTAMGLGSHEAIKRAVQAGFGLGMISIYAAQAELTSGVLARVRLDAPPCKRRLYTLRCRTRYLSATQQAFLTHVKNAVKPGSVP